MSMLQSSPVQMLYTGIFTDERVLQLLHILQALSENCFSKLHEVSNEGQPSSTEYARRFKRGLDSIEFWKPEVKMAETTNAIQQYPELGALYKYTIVRYLKELYKNERADKIPISIPPLHDFVHSYYVALSKTSYMQKLEFLNVYGLERTHMHMEALRNILMEFTRHSIYKPNNLYDNISYMEPTTSAPVGLVQIERDITPDDSVSQRGSDTEASPRDRSRKHKSHSRKSFPSRRNPNSVKNNSGGPSLYDQATQDAIKDNNNGEKNTSSKSSTHERHATSIKNNPPNITNPSQPSTTPQPLVNIPALEIVKENPSPRSDDSRSSRSSTNSDHSPRETKFSSTPKFPPQVQLNDPPKDSRSHVSHKSHESHKSNGSHESHVSSRHTIPLNIPKRVAPTLPSPAYKLEPLENENRPKNNHRSDSPNQRIFSDDSRSRHSHSSRTSSHRSKHEPRFF